MISGSNLGNETVNGSDFHVRASTPGSLGKDRTCRMCVRQNEYSLTIVSGDLPYIVCALVRLPTTCGRLHDDKPCIRSECMPNGIVAHKAISVICGNTTALRTAF